MTTIETLLKMILSSLDDDNRSTRNYVCKLFLIILNSYGKELDKDHLHKLYRIRYVMLRRFENLSKIIIKPINNGEKHFIPILVIKIHAFIKNYSSRY